MMFSTRDFDALPWWAKGIIAAAFATAIGTISAAWMLQLTVSGVKRWLLSRHL
jgi:hypothetical protein